MDHFEAACKRTHPGISRLGVSAHQIDDSVGGFVIFVEKPNCDAFKLDVDLSYSTKEVKRVLADWDASVADQLLLYRETALEDDHTLFDYNLGKGTVLNLRALQLTLKMPDGELKEMLRVGLSDTVKQLKLLVARDVGIPLGHLHLVFMDKRLKDDKGLQQSDIVDGAVLDLVVEPTED